MRIRPLSRRAGTTLIEVMFASIIGLMTAGMLIYLMLFVAKSNAVLAPQMMRQVQTVQTLQHVTDRLRNSEKDSVVVYDNGSLTNGVGDRVDFQQVSMPDGQLSSLRFESTDGVNRLVYYPNTGSNLNKRILAGEGGSFYGAHSQLEEVTFENTGESGNFLEIRSEFKYRKFAGRNATEADRMNGVFITQVWPRN